MPVVADALTPRQFEVIRAYALTGSRKEVAIALGIATQTVDNHLTEIFRRLKVETAIEAFLALDWLDVPDLTPQDVENIALVEAQVRHMAGGM